MSSLRQCLHYRSLHPLWTFATYMHVHFMDHYTELRLWELDRVGA